MGALRHSGWWVDRWGATQLPSAEVKTLHSALREDSATKAAAALMVSLAMSQDYNAATTAWLLRRNRKWFSASDDAAVEVTAAVRAFDALSAHVARAQIVLMYRVATRRATRLRSHDRPSAPAAELPSSRLARLTQRNYERVLATSLPSPRTLEQHRLGGTTNDTGSSTVLSRTALWAALWEASGFLARERRRLEDMEYYHRVALMIDELDVFLADLGITSMYKEERLLRDSIAGESLAAVGTMFAEFVSPMEESQRLDIELDHLQETEDMCRGIATIGEVMERDQMISRGIADLDRDCVRPEVTARCDIARSELESAAELLMSEAETAEEVARHDLSATFAESTNRVSSIAELRHVVSIEEPTARFMLVLEEQETVMGEVKASLFATRTHEVAVGVLEYEQTRDSMSLLMNEMEHFTDLMMACNGGAAEIQHFLLGCEALEIVGLRCAGNVASRQSAREEAWRNVVSLEEEHERSALAKAVLLGECEAHMEELCRIPKMMAVEVSTRYELHRREFYEHAKLEKWLEAHHHAAEVALCRSFVKEYMEVAVLPGSQGHLAHSVLVPTATFNARVLRLQAAEQSAAKAHTTTPHASTPRAGSHNSSSSSSNSGYGDDFDDASTADADQSGRLGNQRASGRDPDRMAVEVVTSAQVAEFARAEEAAAVYTALHPETPSSDATALGGTNGGGARNDGLNTTLERRPSSPTLEDLGWSGGFGRTPEQVPITTGQDRLRGYGGGSLSVSAGSGQLQCFAGSPLGLLRRGSTATPLSPDGVDAAAGLPVPIPDAGQSTSTRRYSVNAPSQYQYQRGPRGSIGRRQSSSVRLIDTLEQHSGGLVPQPSASLQSADGVQPAGAASSLIAQRPGVGVEPLAAIAQDLSSGLASVASFVSSGSATPIRSPLNITSSTALGGGLSPRGRPSAPDPGTSLFPPQSAAEHREPASTRFIPAPVELFPVCPHEWQKTEAELLLQQQERLARRMAAAAPNPLSFSDDGTASGIGSAPEGRSECLSGECPPGVHSATVEKSSSPAARARVGSILRVRSPIAALGAGVSGEFDGTSSSNPAAAAGAQSSSFLTSPLRPGSVPLPTVGGVPVGRAAVTPQPRKKRTAIHLVALRHYTVAARDPHDRSDQDARSAHQSRVPSSTVPEHLPVAKPVSESVRQALLKPLYD